MQRNFEPSAGPQLQWGHVQASLSGSGERSPDAVVGRDGGGLGIFFASSSFQVRRKPVPCVCQNPLALVMMKQKRHHFVKDKHTYIPT